MNAVYAAILKNDMLLGTTYHHLNTRHVCHTISLTTEGMFQPLAYSCASIHIHSKYSPVYWLYCNPYPSIIMSNLYLCFIYQIGRYPCALIKLHWLDLMYPVPYRYMASINKWCYCLGCTSE